LQLFARTNYLLALKDIIKAPRGSDISLPIYLSDSIKIPELEYKIDKGIPNFKFKAGDRTFEVPEYLVQQTSKMDLIFEKIHGHAKNYENRLQEVIKIKGDSEIFRNGLLEALKKSLYDVPEESARDMLVNDLKTMTQLIDEGNDSIWSYILKNILRPIVFMNKKFHFVIGNPPWLAMHFMNDPDYQQFLKDETFRYKLLDRNQTHLYTHMEMATLFFCKVSDIYLEDGGKIAFVMPKSILTANHHANFMKFKFTKLQGNELQLELEKIFNMEKVRPLFNIPSCALIASKSPTGKKHPIPMLVFSGLLPARNEQWNNAKSYLSVKETKYSPRYTKTDDKSITPYYDLFYQGATMFPRNFWFVSIEPDPVFSYQSSLPYVKSDKNNKSKPPWDEVILEGSVESIFLYGTIIGSDLVPFGYKRLSLIVMPLTIEDNKFVIMQSSDMAYGEEYTGIAEYLKKAEDAWRDNATSKAKLFTIYEWLNYRNKLTNQDPKSHYKVLYAATATFLTSCVISYDDELVSNVAENVVIKLKGFIAESKTYFFETNDELEAFYLCAVLNSKVVDDWIKPMQNIGDWGERDIHKRPLLLPIPKFDPNDIRHVSLAMIGKRCKTIIMSNLEKLGTKSIGRDRTLARKLLADELKQINDIVIQLIDI
jgi:hypothetical protein